MSIFIDTSAFYAILDVTDPVHREAGRTLQRLASIDETLLTHSFVLNETIALAHRRLGREAVERLVDDLLPVVEILWVGPELFAGGMAAFRTSSSRVSLVDHLSFAVMRQEHIDQAFAFDQDFEREGFSLLA